MEEQSKPTPKPDDRAADYAAMAEAGREEPTLTRLNNAFRGLLQNSRGRNRRPDAVREAEGKPHVTADDLAMRRAKHVRMQRMIIPEGVIIDGSLTSGSETEISGRIDGGVTVDGFLYLGPSALVSGNVRASSCKIEGLVEGKVDCSEGLELTRTGRVNADIVAGQKVTIAGQVFGSVSAGGKLHLAVSGKITGDIRAKSIVIEEGAVVNGHCTMRTPVQRAQEESGKVPQ